MDKCMLMGMLPADFREHRRAAKRERLLSWRSILDAAIVRLDGSPAEAGQGKMPGMLPDEFWSHRRAAGREELLAFRSLVDAAIRRLQETPAAERATPIDVM